MTHSTQQSESNYVYINNPKNPWVDCYSTSLDQVQDIYLQKGPYGDIKVHLKI